MKNIVLLFIEGVLTATFVVLAGVSWVLAWIAERVADVADVFGRIRHSSALPPVKATNAVDRDGVPV